MKFNEVKPKDRKFTVELNLKEASILKAVLGNINSEGQNFTALLWEAFEKADIPDTHIIQTGTGAFCPTLSVKEN